MLKGALLPDRLSGYLFGPFSPKRGFSNSARFEANWSQKDTLMFHKNGKAKSLLHSVMFESDAIGILTVAAMSGLAGFSMAGLLSPGLERQQGTGDAGGTAGRNFG